jgi:hypothetical protein
MIKNIKITALLLIVIFSTPSCKKWLEIKPQDGKIREDYWQTRQQVEAAVIGCYVSLANASLVQSLFTWGELRADMVELTNTASTEEVNYATANIQSTNSLTKWNSIYTVINNCNTVIEYAPLVLSSDKTVNQQQINAYIGEARGIRALMYFYLLRTFGEVPLQLKAVSSDARQELLPKSSQEEVFKVIIEDLAFAELNVPQAFGTDPRQNKGRLTRYVINAIQADAYLWMAGKDHTSYYTECVKACDKIIASGNFGLISGADQTTWYNELFYEGNSNESIFELQFDSQLLNPFFAMLGNSTRRFIARQTVLDDVYGFDYVDPLNKDIRADAGSVRATDLVIWKFAGTLSITTLRTQAQSTAHWVIYRYADILLLKAEALAWLSRGEEALDLVKQVRTRANALQVTEEFPPPDNPVAVCDYILKERAREFAFEGKRWYDLLRNAKRDNYAQLDIILNMINTIAPADKQELMIAKYTDVRSHYLPINLSELQADKNLVQNPFYE